jgi:2-iminobutanoate/2-iminopropanoate deaminase
LHALPAFRQGHQGRVKQAISSPDAPNPAGAYSPALRAGDLLFLSGQIPINPATGQLVQGDAAVQARRVMDNLGALLAAAGLSFDHVVRTTVFLADMNDFAVVNDVYSSYFTEPRPARATVQVARLPRDARIEIDAIASYAIT